MTINLSPIDDPATMSSVTGEGARPIEPLLRGLDDSRFYLWAEVGLHTWVTFFRGSGCRINDAADRACGLGRSALIPGECGSGDRGGA